MFKLNPALISQVTAGYGFTAFT
jgi:hypothetical protein